MSLVEINNFWNWFVKNHLKYENINDSTERQSLLDLFLKELHKYSNKLFFQIGGYPSGIQELIITAEGDKAHFDEVIRLVEAAPYIDNWEIIAFIPPMEPSFNLIYEGIEINTSEVYFMPLENDVNIKEIGIIVILENYEKVKKSEWLNACVGKILDMVLGEKSFALDIEYYRIEGFVNIKKEEVMKLDELPNYVNWHKEKYR